MTLNQIVARVSLLFTLMFYVQCCSFFFLVFHLVYSAIMSEKKSVFVKTKVVLLDWQKTQRLGWKIYSVNVMKFLTNYCGPHDYIKLTNSFRLF